MNASTYDIEMESHYMADDEEEQEHTHNTEPHFTKNSNVRELEMLCREIDHIMANGISPPEAWYERRYENLQTYSELGWTSMAQRFHHIDHYIQNTSMNILNNLEDLMEEYHNKQFFHLRNYQHLLHDIGELWTYYQTTYIGNESDPDVGELIVGLTHMMRHL